MSRKTTDLLDSIIAFEDGSLSEEGTIELFQRLVNTGWVWQLQGLYQRTAMALLAEGLVVAPGATVTRKAVLS